MNKKIRSTKSEKWRHACNSVEIAWTNEQTVGVTSYGRNKNHDDEIKKNQEKANNSLSDRCAAIKKLRKKWSEVINNFKKLVNFKKVLCLFNRKHIPIAKHQLDNSHACKRFFDYIEAEQIL